jgi:hypothetical protein
MAADPPLTVACVLRSGGIYQPGHVAGLKRQVSHFMPGVRFVCLSDAPVPCERVELDTEWPGWWAKIRLFDHFKDRTLYFDLDTVLVRDPSLLACGQFRMIRNWRSPQLMASGVMYWDGDYSHISRAFEPIAQTVMDTYVTRDRWGDQAFIAEQAGTVEPFPGAQIESWLYSMERSRKAPKRACVVTFNNDAPPWTGPPWARRWYEDTAA